MVSLGRPYHFKTFEGYHKFYLVHSWIAWPIQWLCILNNVFRTQCVCTFIEYVRGLTQNVRTAIIHLLLYLCVYIQHVRIYFRPFIQYIPTFLQHVRILCTMFLYLLNMFLQPATLLKKRPWHRFFPMNFEEIFKNTLF